jgi:large subunit ribosomal protein L23
MAKTTRNPRDVIIEPVVTEKSYGQIDSGKYTFVVHPDATKTAIRRAVEEIFGVTVVSVNTITRPSKKRRSPRTWKFGKTAERKHAVVTLAEGEKIDLFEG